LVALSLGSAFFSTAIPRVFGADLPPDGDFGGLVRMLEAR
jgi:hypothetical protein